jgi:hypothetical protein
VTDKTDASSKLFRVLSILLFLGFALLLARFFVLQIADPLPYSLVTCTIEKQSFAEAEK